MGKQGVSLEANKASGSDGKREKNTEKFHQAEWYTGQKRHEPRGLLKTEVERKGQVRLLTDATIGKALSGHPSSLEHSAGSAGI